MSDGATDRDWAERMARQDPEAVAWFARTFQTQLTSAEAALHESVGTLGVSLPALLSLLAEAIGRGYLRELADGPQTLQDYVADRHLSDLLLAAACLAGDGGAFGRLHALIDGPVGRWLHRNQRDKAPQFVVEEALVGLPRHLLAVISKNENVGRARLATYHGRSSLVTWLRGVVRKRVPDVLRQRLAEKKQPPRAVTPDHAPDVEGGELETLGRQLGKRLWELIDEAITQMPPRRAVATRLRLHKRLRRFEIAEVMAISRPAVTQHLDAARDDVLRTVLASDLSANLAGALGIPAEEAERLLRRGIDDLFDENKPEPLETEEPV